MAMVKRFEVHLVSLDGSAQAKMKRPCVIISPDEMNRYLSTVIIAPLTTSTKKIPTRVDINFRFKSGQIALEQLRTVDKKRLIQGLGKVSNKAKEEILKILGEMFSE
jgi:mRNA interferase MazF